jgi:hypothetical protein
MVMVNVLVPEERVLEVYALLGQPPGKASAPVQAPAKGSEWPREELARYYRQSPKAMKAFLDHLAANAGSWVTIEEVAGKLRLTPQQVAGVMGAGGRRLHNRHGKEAGKNGWFLEFERNHDLGMIQYRMPEEVAEAIREAQD